MSVFGYNQRFSEFVLGAVSGQLDHCTLRLPDLAAARFHNTIALARHVCHGLSKTEFDLSALSEARRPFTVTISGRSGWRGQFRRARL